MKPKKEKKTEITWKKEKPILNTHVAAPSWERKSPAQIGGETATGVVAGATPVYTVPQEEKKAAAPVKVVPETTALPIYQRDTYTPAEAYAAILRQQGQESIRRKENKELPVEETELYKALKRVRSGKSPTPTLEEVYAEKVLPIYLKDTYVPASGYGAAAQRVELPETTGGYKRGGLISMEPAPMDEEEQVEREAIERYEAARGAVGQDFMPSYAAASGALKSSSGASPVASGYAAASGALKSEEERGKRERLAELGIASRELPLPTVAERTGLTLSGAGKQYAGSLAQTAATAVDQIGLDKIVDQFSGPMGSVIPGPILKLAAAPLEKKLVNTVQGFSDKAAESGARDIAKAQKGLDPMGRWLVSAGVGASQMAGDAGIALATGGSAMIPMLARSFGGGVQEARAKGYSKEQQALLGFASAATEFFSEKLFGGNPVYDDDIGLVNRLVEKVVKNPKVMEILASAPVDTLTEGLEEMASDLLNPVAEWAITGTEPEYELEQIIEDGAVGVLTALIAKGGARAMNTAVGNRIAGRGTDTAQAEKTAPGEGTESTYIDTDPSTHTPEQQRVIAEYQANTDGSLKKFFETYLKNPKQGFSRYNISEVTQRQANDVKRLLGGEYDGYTNAINSNGVLHILREHGPEGTVDHTLEDLNDISRLSYILEQYDDVEIVTYQSGEVDLSQEFRTKNNRPAPMLRFRKRVDGTYYVIEAIPESKYKKFWVVSAYMKKADGGTQAPNTNGPGNTPNASLASSPSAFPIMSQEGREVKGKFVRGDDPIIRDIRRLWEKDETTGEANGWPY